MSISRGKLSFAASSSIPSWRDSIPEGRAPARRDLAVEGILRHSRSYKPGETGFHRSEDDLAREIENIFHRAGEDRQSQRPGERSSEW